MTPIIVVDNPSTWTLAVPGASVMSAREYLADAQLSRRKRVKVFNLCRSYAYQTVGYYVSLLAAARGHRPLPSVSTLQDFRSSAVLRIVSEELDALMQRSLADLKSERFTLSVYFGRNLATRYERLSRALFNAFPVPLLRAEFRFRDTWRLESIRPIAAGDIPESHKPFVLEQATRFFNRGRPGSSTPKQYRYDIGILHNPEEQDAPSNERALYKFMHAARQLGMHAELITREDYGHVAEFDALFIRETTAVNHHTYQFARRAAAAGLVVLDDPVSIIRCTNKVYLAELFQNHGIPCPRTWVVSEDSVDACLNSVTYPCVVKQPDSSFSKGVSKANTPAELCQYLDAIFETSALAIVQEFVSSTFDWRVGVLDGKPLFACKYHLAAGDWRIQVNDARGRKHYGRIETLAIADTPPQVVELAMKSATPIGDGIYGVDIKESGRKLFVMEVNDNPNLDAGVEDEVLQDELYVRVMRTFYDRLERRGRNGT